MDRQTFERALHKWPDWSESITKSRQVLGYDPKWSQGKCIRWIEKHYHEIRKQGASELERLELPRTLQQYWEDCLYSDYQAQGGSTKFDDITRRLSNQKSLPELPCDWGVVWPEEGEIHDPWLRVEIRIHARFATRELFDYAAGHGFQSVEGVLAGGQFELHPVCQWLKGGRPPAKESIAIECARLKDVQGWTYKQIGESFRWPIQSDSYGNPNQCSTARNHVKRGRELIRQYQQ